MEEDLPRAKPAFVAPDLSRWDVDDLNGWVATLQAEIARAQAAIARKQAHRSAADLLFRKPE